MSNSSSNSGSGIGFFGALGLLFIALKITNVIDWSWWYVLMPIYLPAIVAFVVLAGVFAWASKK